MEKCSGMELHTFQSRPGLQVQLSAAIGNVLSALPHIEATGHTWLLNS